MQDIDNFAWCIHNRLGKGVQSVKKSLMKTKQLSYTIWKPEKKKVDYYEEKLFLLNEIICLYLIIRLF